MFPMQQLVHALEPWQSAYSNSKALPTVVTAVHLGALLFGGGLAVTSDRAMLRALRAGPAERERQLGVIHGSHRTVLAALTLMLVSGLLMATADVKTFLTTPAFYVKLGFVTLLVLNGAALTFTETRLRRAAASPSGAEAGLWDRLRLTCRLSMALWGATLVAGVTLANVS
ncbi:MAG TPA: hypothetical protein VIC24_12640 [Gemmatimonadaceae bacterium]|jgi:hypothetical protein